MASPRWSSPSHSDPNGSPPSRSARRWRWLMLVWNPPVGDLAAQVFRTELFQQAGLAIWNGSWYGGHYTLTYSVLFPPLAALLGPQLVGGARRRLLLLPLRPPRPRPLGGRGALGDPLVRRRRGHPARRRPAHLRPGSRLRPRGAALPADRARQAGAPRRGRPARSSSPVAAVFLAGVVLAGAWERGRPRQPRRARGRRPRPRPHHRPQPRLPRSRASSPSPSPPSSRSRSGAAARCFVTRGLPEERQLRRVLVGYVLASTLIWLTPERDRRQRGPPRRPLRRPGAGRGRPRPPARPSSASPRPGPGADAGRQPLLAADRQRQPDRPQRRRPLDLARPTSNRRRRWLRAHGGQGMRIEVPPTANHWESAYLAPKFELARGWLRQLDTTRDDIFYDEGELTNARLQRLAARQRDLLRGAARRPARLLLGGRAPADPQRTRPT